MQQAVAIFKSWFVEYSPFDGIAPKEWETVNLEKITSLISRGIAPKYSDNSDQTVINQKCIRNHMIDLSQARTHTPKVINEKWLRFGDLLINSTGDGTLGRTAQVWFQPQNITVDSHVTIVRPAKENLIWRIDGQRVEVLPPKKTARAEAKKYLIQYKLKGGKIKGRRINKHEYGKAMKLPSLYRKGYRFLGWHIYYNKDWHYYQMEIKPNANGKIVAEAVFKQIKISAENQRIQVMVKDPNYGKRNYLKEMDNYYFRYSENPDMSNSTWVFSTTPYGKGISKKLKKGRVYYVQIAERTLGFEEEDDDMWNPTLGWLIKKKIRMK